MCESVIPGLLLLLAPLSLTDSDVGLAVYGPVPGLAPSPYYRLQVRLGHLAVVECSEELLRQKSYAKKLGHLKPPTRGFVGGILLAPRCFFMA